MTNETKKGAAVELVAFDYERQEWVEGEAARPLLIEQLTKEQVLLRGPRAKEFAGRGLSVPAALALCESRLKELQAERGQQ
jgi:hypothetical protein